MSSLQPLQVTCTRTAQEDELQLSHPLEKLLPPSQTRHPLPNAAHTQGWSCLDLHRWENPPTASHATQQLLYRKQKGETPKDLGMRSLYTHSTPHRWASPTYSLLRLQLKTTARHQKQPEGLDFIQASCRASNHSSGIRLQQPPSPEQFSMGSLPTPVNEISAWVAADIDQSKQG